MRKIDTNYLLEYKKLGTGEHKIEYIIDEKFFEKFKYSEIHKGNIIAQTKIKINGSNISTHIHFTGTVEVQCDICLEYFDLEIDTEIDLIFKIVHQIEQENTNDEIIYISENDNTIDLSKHFYDYIILSIPIKKVHPLDDKGNRTCKTEYLEKLEELQSSSIKNIPDWEKIKNFFN
jgi:uncharacterized metal-binding protein YceD (DUF177 family)